MSALPDSCPLRVVYVAVLFGVVAVVSLASTALALVRGVMFADVSFFISLASVGLLRGWRYSRAISLALSVYYLAWSAMDLYWGFQLHFSTYQFGSFTIRDAPPIAFSVSIAVFTSWAIACCALLSARAVAWTRRALPNQPPEPTAMADTPPAGQESRQP